MDTVYDALEFTGREVRLGTHVVHGRAAARLCGLRLGGDAEHALKRIYEEHRYRSTGMLSVIRP